MATARDATLTVIDAILKDTYLLEEIQNAVNKSTVLLSRLQTSRSIVGRKGFFSVQVGIHQGVGARSENATLPVAGWAEYIQPQVQVKYLYGRFNVTGPTIAATRDSKGAFAEAIKRSLKDTREGLKLDVQRQVWGAGDGKMALTTEASSDTTLTVASPYGLSRYDNNHPVKYIKRQAIVDIVQSGGTVDDSDITVTAVSHGAEVTTLTQGSSWSNTNVGDFVFRYDMVLASEIELRGLNAIVDTVGHESGGKYLGITRSSYPEWQSSVVDNSAVAITEAKIRSMLDLVETEGDARPDLIITNYNQRAKYEALLTPSKRFVNPMELEGGFRALEFDGLPIVVDKDAPPEHWWFISTPTINWFQMSDFAWMDKAGSVLQQSATKDAYFAQLYKYADLGCTDPADNAVLYGCAP